MRLNVHMEPKIFWYALRHQHIKFMSSQIKLPLRIIFKAIGV